MVNISSLLRKKNFDTSAFCGDFHLYVHPTPLIDIKIHFHSLKLSKNDKHQDYEIFKLFHTIACSYLLLQLIGLKLNHVSRKRYFRLTYAVKDIHSRFQKKNKLTSLSLSLHHVYTPFHFQPILWDLHSLSLRAKTVKHNLLPCRVMVKVFNCVYLRFCLLKKEIFKVLSKNNKERFFINLKFHPLPFRSYLTSSMPHFSTPRAVLSSSHHTYIAYYNYICTTLEKDVAKMIKCEVWKHPWKVHEGVVLFVFIMKIEILITDTIEGIHDIGWMRYERMIIFTFRVINGIHSREGVARL